MTTTVHIGFIGAGRMADLHAGHLQHIPGVRIVAAADTNVATAHAFAAKWGGMAYTGYQELLAGARLDAVYICTPTPAHSAIGMACVEAGVALFVEKPLDLDLRAARHFVEAAEARGLMAMTAFQWRYTEAYRRAEELIGEEPIALVNMRWYWTRPPIRWMWNREIAGGQVVDQSIHLLDVGRGLAGDVATVYAAYNTQQVNFEPEFRNWDAYALTLRYKRGAVGTSASTYALFPEIQKQPSVDFALRDCMVRITDRGISLFKPDGVQEWTNSEPLHRPVNRAFITAVRTRDPRHIRTPLRAGLLSTALALAANHSAAAGQPVDVDDFLQDATA
jgi:predicted dehydrogenase